MTIASWGFAPALAAGNAVRAQARRVDAADHDPPRRARARGRAARGPVPGAAGQGLGRRGALRHPPRRAQDRVHRLDRGRHQGHGRGAPRRSSRSRSSSAARAPTSSSPTATWRRRRRPRPTACSTTPARTAARAAASWCSAASTTGSWSCSSRPSRASWSATPTTRDTEMGPLVSRQHFDIGGRLRARRRPGRLPRLGARRARATGSRRPCSPRRAPTARSTEEIFGPVVTVLPFDDEADAIALANDTDYGLSGSIWTDNLSRALRVSRGVESRQPVGQLALVGALHHPVRRVQAVRPRPRARTRCAAALHRNQERLLRDTEEHD